MTTPDSTIPLSWLKALNPYASLKFRYKLTNVTHSAWGGHVVFAAFLVRETRPGLLVELGSQWGCSYFAFCQSVIESGLPTRCFAVDTWEGEEQAGFYGPQVFEYVNRFNTANFPAFSTLLREKFDTAATRFADESIDILHIDGLHSYDAVRHDFDTWLGKVKPGGIVLFHDVAERKDGFGVWKLWDEITRGHVGHFAFSHSHGLGVWRKPGGENLQSELLTELLRGNPTAFEFSLPYFVCHSGEEINHHEAALLMENLISVRRELDNVRKAAAPEVSKTIANLERDRKNIISWLQEYQLQLRH